MGCCSSKAGEVNEQNEPDQTKRKFRLIKVNKPVKVPSRTAWNESDNSGPEVSLSAQSFSIPVPPLGKKPSSPTFRRRSGVRLASSMASPSHEDGTQSSVQVHPVPSTSSTGSVHTPRPPTGKKSVSPIIKRRSGVRLAISSSSNSVRADYQCRPASSEVADASPSSLPKEHTQAAPEATESVSNVAGALDSTTESAVAESFKASGDGLAGTSASSQRIDDILDSALNETMDVPVRAEDAEASQAVGTRHLSMDDDKCLVPEQSLGQKSEEVAMASQERQLNEERQVFQDVDEQKEGNEEALRQAIELVQPSCEPQDVPRTSMPDATPVLDTRVPSSELEIERAASVLVSQALQEAILQEEADSGSQIIDDKSNKAIVLPMEPAVVAPKSERLSFPPHLEPANDTEDAWDKLAKILAQQAIEAASLDLGISFETAPASEESDSIPALHCGIQVHKSDGDQVAKIARIMSAKAIETAIHDVTISETNAVVHDLTVAKLSDNGTEKAKPNDESEAPSNESDEELVVRGKAITIPKTSKAPKASGSSNNVKTKAPVKKTDRAREKVRQSRSFGAVATKAQPPLNKKSQKKTSALGKSRSVGTVVKAKVTENTNTKTNRSSSLSTVAKSSAGTAAIGKKSTPPMAGKTGNAAKKLKPLKTDSKPRRADHTFIAAKSVSPKKTIQAKGGDKLPAMGKTSLSQGHLSKEKKASKTSMKVQVTRKKSNGLAEIPLVGSSQPDKRAGKRNKTVVNTVKSSKPEIIKKKSFLSDESKSGDKKALDLVSFQSESSKSSQEIRTKSSSPSLQAPMKSFSEKGMDGKSIPKLSHLSSPKTQSPSGRTSAWLNGVDVTHGVSTSSPSVSPKGSSMSVTGKPSAPRSTSSSSLGSRRISVDRIPTSSPIRIRSGSSKHSQEL